jgi:hypothetical protein
MAWILKTLWSCLLSGRRSGLRSGPRFVPRSRLSGSPTVDAVAQVSGVNAPGACGPSAGETLSTPQKRFYSLIIEVRPEEADAETLQLFS